METKKRSTSKSKAIEGDCWTYQGDCLSIPPPDIFGFVYLITNKLDGRIYVGKKQFLHKTKTRLSKRTIKATKTRQRVVRGTKDSGWLTYWGSCKELTADIAKLGVENFSREILGFYRNKAELAYYEVLYQIQLKVLFGISYNGWISCKIFKNKL